MECVGFASARRTVAAMIAEDVPFERIEAYIEDRPLEGEDRALLWLYAFLGGEVDFIAEELGRVALAVS